jgi:2-polyprenyl-6-methoxyphenol hydroxylase-like FAD-dependent oxidoreductase
MGRQGEHAVVIGASIAGLCAARVLSDFYDRVTLFERDALPETPTNRTAVPQGKHLHLLMARGADEFGALFPGLLEDMVAAGVPILKDQPGCLHFGAAGHVLGIPTDPGQMQETFTTYIPSRPHLEWQIRRRAASIPNIEIARRSVDAPRFDIATQRVTGVALDPRNGVGVPPAREVGVPPACGGEPDFVPADIVVDATGRGTRLPVWLQQWGFERPREDSVEVGIHYATHLVDIPDGYFEQKVVVSGASRAKPRGLGMLQYEDGSWILTTFGVAKVEPPRNFKQMCALADEVLPPHIAAALCKGEPMGDVAFHRYPTSRWRRYDKLERFPAGIVPFGDSVASFNPTYGQGMTMTSLQAGHLHRALESGDPDLPRAVNRAIAKTTFPVWMMNAIGDHMMHQAAGPAPRWYRPVGQLFDQFLGAAETEPVLAEWFLRRFSLLDSLYMVPPLTIVGRTMRHNMRCWWAERRIRPAYRQLASRSPV